MQIVSSFQNIFKIPELRTRIFWTFGLLFVFRLGAHIPLPGINPIAIDQFRTQASDALGGVWGFMQVFSGGALGNLALFSLGIMPYITASIIMQLMTKVYPALEEIAKEGPSGQRKIQQYTRYAAVPICMIQGFFAAKQLAGVSVGQIAANQTPLMMNTGVGGMLYLMLGLTAGAMFVMWLGEQITERGIGNGASVLIMAGIIARLPSITLEMVEKARTGDISKDSIILIFVIYVAAIVGIVFVTQAQRRIPLQHAKHIRGRRMMTGMRSYLPLRVNTAGVMPVIFASSVLMVPQMLSMIPGLSFLKDVITPSGPGWFVYSLLYTIMIFFFAYFWTYLFFQPNDIALNLKENGSFVPGIRPGENTAVYLNTILARITLCGAAFLCLIALLPDIISAGLGLRRYLVAFLGGTGILICVGVGLDLIQKMESYLLMHNYTGFLGPGGARIQGRRG